MDLWEFEAVDWDDSDDEDGNLVHCQAHGVDELVIADVLGEDPKEVKLANQTTEWAVVGPDAGGAFWTLLFDRSYKRGDWLRPVTGWRSKESEVREWRRR